MQLEEFQSKIYKRSKWDKILFSGLAVSFFSMGTFLLYDTINNSSKYEQHTTKYISISFSLILIITPLWCYYFIKNKYKVSTVTSLLPINNKEKVVIEVISKYGNPIYEISDFCYTVLIRGNWYTADRIVFINLDEFQYSLSIESQLQVGKTLFDLGNTQKIRKYIIGSIKILSVDNSERHGEIFNK